MLSEEKNELLTRVGPGTPMGGLLRRYWHPVAAEVEFEDRATKRVRLLGEDLVLYRDLSGTYGLVDRHCAHRRADLSYGFVEQKGIRCNYHGWLFDETGACIEQPYEDVAGAPPEFKRRSCIKGYRAQAHAGMVWAYMGPEPAPLVPNYEPFTWKNGFVQIVFSQVPCNWFQCQENSIDPVHFEWMHDNWSIRLRGKGEPYASRHLKVAFDEFEHGMIYRRVRSDADETSPLWTIGRLCLWPNSLFTGNHFEWRVPVDDHTTLSIGWFFSRVPTEMEPYQQNRIPAWTSPVFDSETGEPIVTHVMNQDFVAWFGQGVIADRTRENLGKSDLGIVMMRRRFMDDLEVVAAGGDPKGIIRDPERNRCLELPIINKEAFLNGVPLKEVLAKPRAINPTARQEFIWLKGQPEEVRRAYNEAMGFPA